MTAEEFLGLKEYIKHALKLEWRTDLSGNKYIGLLLEDELISAIIADNNIIEEDERV